MIDYRIDEPTSDGETKQAHVAEMLDSLSEDKQVPCQTVLMDTGLTQISPQFIEGLGRI